MHHILLNIGLEMGELVIVLFIALIFFGVGKLPEAGKGLGEAIRNFRKGFRGEDEDQKLEEKASKQISPSS